ncbi:MAG: hypothetical protein RRY33_07475 [Alistipes sp.]
MKKLLLITTLLALLVGLSSCESDETVYDRIVGRVWIGNLGFVSDDAYHYPLESGIYFGSDGFGDDELCYADGQSYAKLRCQWFVEDGDLYIDYGRVADPRELRNVYVGHGSLTGDLFVGGYSYGTVTLHMQ